MIQNEEEKKDNSKDNIPTKVNQDLYKNVSKFFKQKDFTNH